MSYTIELSKEPKMGLIACMVIYFEKNFYNLPLDEKKKIFKKTLNFYNAIYSYYKKPGMQKCVVNYFISDTHVKLWTSQYQITPNTLFDLFLEIFQKGIYAPELEKNYSQRLKESLKE